MLARSQVMSACIPPATLSTAGRPASPWRRSPGIVGKPATKGWGSRWQHMATAETELGACSRLAPAQPGSGGQGAPHLRTCRTHKAPHKGCKLQAAPSFRECLSKLLQGLKPASTSTSICRSCHPTMPGKEKGQ